MAIEINKGAQKCVSWTIFGLSIISFIFSCVAVGHCSFVKSGTDGSSKTGIGLFKTEASDDRCIEFSDGLKDSLDGIDKSARAFGTMAALFCGFAAVLVVSIQCCLTVALKPLWLTVRVLFVAAFLAQVLTFMIFGSDLFCKDENDEDFGCTLGTAGIIAVLNVIGLATLIALSWLVPPPDHPILDVKMYKQGQSTNTGRQPRDEEAAVEESSKQEETTKITYEDGPNGQRTITKEVTHPDGSKTITTTVEELDVPDSMMAQSAPQQQGYEYGIGGEPQHSSGKHAGRYGEE